VKYINFAVPDARDLTRSLLVGMTAGATLRHLGSLWRIADALRSELKGLAE